MYKIEWKKNSENSLRSLHIDGRKYHSDCQKFAERCNELEQILQDIYEMLPPEYDDYLQNPKILAQIKEEHKWIPYSAAEEILGKGNLQYFITQGELGWSVIGELKVFDMWDIVQVQNLIKGSNENNIWDVHQIQELVNMDKYYLEIYKVNELRAALESALGCLKQGEYWCQKPEVIINKCEEALK